MTSGNVVPIQPRTSGSESLTDSVRSLEDWHKTWMEYTEEVWSPKLYRAWVGYCVLSTIVERRVWCHLIGKETFCNLYVMLVAGPGVGKTVGIDAGLELIKAAGDTRFAPSGMTKAAFMDHLHERGTMMHYNGFPVRYHHMCIAAGELGVLLPDYNIDFLNMMNEIYDCRIKLDERTRMHGHKEVEHPCITFVAGTQPAYLNYILPETAFGMGFTSRLIMVYAERQPKRSLLSEIVTPEPLKQKLVHDLKLMKKLVGPMKFTKEAGLFYDDWHLNRSEDDQPDHPLLEHYCDRRARHVQKLAMLNSISRGNSLIIEKEDYERAIEFLIETEVEMPNIFRDMQASVDARHLEEIHRWCFKYLEKNKTDCVPEQDMISYIVRRVPVHKMKFFLETLVSTGRITFKGSDSYPVGQREVIPRVLGVD